MRLSEIVNDLPVVQMSGPWDAEIAGITTDSRRVKQGWLFVATPGEHVDGHDFVQTAMERGASCVVVQLTQYESSLHSLLTPAYCQHNGTTVVVVRDTRKAVAVLADRFFASPSRALTMIGITGTNGKTTISYLLSSVLATAGIRSGLIGTVEYRIGDSRRPAPFTTPPAEHLHELFAEMRDEGCTAVVMEVSSHSIALDRVHGVQYDVAVFTNLTQDHLDFHETMDEYRDVKSRLFSEHTRGVALINADDDAARAMGMSLKRRRKTYGAKGRVAYRIRDVNVSARGTTLTIEYGGTAWPIRSKLVGGFNAWNIAAAFAVGIELGIDPQKVIRGLQRVRNIAGRFERIASADGVTAIVDYSHSPDSLEKAVRTSRDLAGDRRVITVFGCGGDRDRAKRPLMGAVASELSDITVVTSDNPRTEDPAAIIEDILEGIETKSGVVIRIRRRAGIQYALKIAMPGDIVLIAGKGHEDYQIIGNRRRHFDDREVVRAFFSDRRGGVKA
ncbi:MAG: UDP-N-acetylmuramoyl-L-alanyl-D-glutamate--2,6-diaminopimelate ligase [Ignavibacteria bacterium]|nr:MAG: UDP-N-acetylmuramoyl-L-alanyl-D-glutamate--2,6-diaminopimelate ligase [Ignavibacteria bacterium]